MNIINKYLYNELTDIILDYASDYKDKFDKVIYNLNEHMEICDYLGELTRYNNLLLFNIVIENEINVRD
jgi:hypothetical protein